jgi:hypothetical protein
MNGPISETQYREGGVQDRKAAARDLAGDNETRRCKVEFKQEMSIISSTGNKKSSSTQPKTLPHHASALILRAQEPQSFPKSRSSIGRVHLLNSSFLIRDCGAL